MGSRPWQNRFLQGSWEILYRRLSVSGMLTAMPSEHPICNYRVEVRSGIRRIQTRSRHEGRFYLCNLIDGVYDLALTGIDDPLPNTLRIQMAASKYEASSNILKSSEPLDFDLDIMGATVVNGWICALHFELKNQNISKIYQWNKEVTHA